MTKNTDFVKKGTSIADYHSFATTFKIGNTQADVFCDSTFLFNTAEIFELVNNREANDKKNFHNHSYNEIIIIVKGNLKLQTETESVEVEENSVCFFPQKYLHVLRFSPDCKYYAIEFTFKKLPITNKFLNTYEKFNKVFSSPVILNKQNELISIANQISSAINKPTEFSYFITESLVRLFVLKLYENSAKISDKGNSDTVPVIANINHLINQRINNINSDAKLKDIADELFISKRQLCRIIKKQYGVTYTQRKMQLRIESAKLLLKNSDLSMEKIAERCSFYDTGTFIKKFTSYTGISPHQYRLKYQAPTVDKKTNPTRGTSGDNDSTEN